MNLYAVVDVQRKTFVMLKSASGFGRFTSVKLPTASRTVDIEEDAGWVAEPVRTS
jgi:hypothetical protein